MPTEHISPAGIAPSSGYTHVVASDGRRIVFVSGQVPYDTAGNLVGEGDLAAQTRQVFANLKTCLASVGASFADVVKMTTYVVDYQFSDREIIAAARAEHLPADKPPASTLVGVSALARPGIRVEIEAIAVLP